MVLGFRRAKTDVRRQQIVEATLGLLADSPLDQLSTRQIARELGISQPALFRHFTSRDDLLLAVIATTQKKLGQVAEGVLSSAIGPVQKLELLAVELLRHLDQNPGLPRLLFANVASGEGPVLGALRQLYSMQRGLVAELVRDGQRAGEIDPSLDARDAATLFVGLLQGVTLIRRLETRGEPLETEGRRLLAIWQRGVRATCDERTEPAPARAHARGLATLDVRPLLAQGVDPLETVLAELAAVGPGGVLKMTAPFRPAPLLSLLASRGHAVRDERVDEREYAVEVIHGGEPEPEDLRDLEPPEPLERVLVAVEGLAPGQVYLARVPRLPRLLFPRLEERGVSFEAHEEHDGTALVRVFRP